MGVAMNVIRHQFAGLALLSVSASACASAFELAAPPAGMVEVPGFDYDDDDMRFKAADRVGVRVVAFDNYDGGTLTFWAGDLVEKLQARGYVLLAQQPVASANGVAGTRFDFSYDAGTNAATYFYTAVLFISDEHRVVAQVAGRKEYRSAHEATIAQLIAELDVHCPVGGKHCRGPQPPLMVAPQLTTSPHESASTGPVSTQPSDDADVR